MLSQRKRSPWTKPGVGKKATTSVRKRPPPPKPEWNSYLTDDNKFKMTQEEALRKKKLIVSKHNIFSDGSVSVPSLYSPSKRSDHATFSSKNTTTPTSTAEAVHLHDDNEHEVNALDLLNSDDEKEDKKTPTSSSRKKRDASSAQKPVKKQQVATESNKTNIGSTAKRLAFGRHDTKNEVRRISRVSSGSVVVPEGDAECTEKYADGENSDDADDLFEATGSGLSRATVNRTPSPSKLRAMNTSFSSQSRRSVQSASPSFTNGLTRSVRKSLSHNNKTNKFLNSGLFKKDKDEIEEEKDYDLVYVADEVRALFSELKYYEELSGRRSILDTREELEQMLKDEALIEPREHKHVMRYLVQLVCQSMTYLLKSEVDLQDQQKHYQQLRDKYETLNSLLSPDSIVPNVTDFAPPAPLAFNALLGTAGTSGVSAAPESGIAFRADDLYPQQAWHSPEAVPTVSKSVTQLGAVDDSNVVDDASFDMGSSRSGLRHLALQYAQDDLYPVPADADSDARDYGGDADLRGQGSRLMPSIQNTMAPFSSPVLSAKVSSTPARFQDKINDAGAANACAGNRKVIPTAEVNCTPLRPVVDASTHQNPYNSVNSICSTPPVGMLAKKYGGVGNMRNVGMNSPDPAHIYQHITSPASYVDAYASYIPATRKNKDHTDAHTSNSANAMVSTPLSGKSAAVPVRPPAPTKSEFSFPAADLTRMDELLEYSKRIAASPATLSFTPGSGGGGGGGGEYSTISRLVSVGGHCAGADDSMVSGPYHHDSILLNDSSREMARDESSFTRRAPSINEQFKYLYGSHESNLSIPPPPPPLSRSGNAESQQQRQKAIHATVGGLPIRQPAAATTMADRVMYLPSSQPGFNGQNNVTSGMSGSSPSDWLFNAFPSAPVSTSKPYSQPTNISVGMVTPTRDVKKVNISSTDAMNSTVVRVPAPQQGTVHTAAKGKTKTPTTTEIYPVRGMNDNFNHIASYSYDGEFNSSRGSHQDHGDQVNSDETIDRLTQQLSTAASLRTAIPPPSTRTPQQLHSQQQQQQLLMSTPELHGSGSGRASSMPSSVTSGVRGPPIVQVTKTTPLKDKLKANNSSRSNSQQHQHQPQHLVEGVSIITPNSFAPSPQSAPIHPFYTQKSTARALNSNLPSTPDGFNSNQSTPTATLTAYDVTTGRVFDARGGSY